MPKSQKKFSTLSALAIVEMLATLAEEDYSVEIYHTASEMDDDGERYYPFEVVVMEKANDEVAATGRSFFLSDALADAYSATPERGN